MPSNTLFYSAMKKTLIYHLYCGDDFIENPANMIHFICLNNVINNFDEVRFVIAVDKLGNFDLIKNAMNWILGLNHFGEKKIRVTRNTDLYEVETFKTEFLERYEELDGMVFFAHNKGTTNINRDGIFQMNVARWICGMYYYNFEYLKEIEGLFTGTLRAPEVFYGTFLQNFSKERQCQVHAMPNNTSGLIYSGTFYWINMPKYKNCRKMGIIKDVEADSRFFAEEYPGMFFDRYAYGCGITSHNDAILDAITYNIYNLTEEQWGEVLEILGDAEGFASFSNEVLLKLFKDE